MKKRLRKMAGWTLFGLPFIGLLVFMGLTWGMEGVWAFFLIGIGVSVLCAIFAAAARLIVDE